MTKKTTINKIISSKAFWIIISLLASFLLWTYIMSTEETTIEKTFSNVKVVYQGADDLRAARGLIVTDADRASQGHAACAWKSQLCGSVCGH